MWQYKTTTDDATLATSSEYSQIYFYVLMHLINNTWQTMYLVSAQQQQYHTAMQWATNGHSCD